jgi:hypothetical protein
LQRLRPQLLFDGRSCRGGESLGLLTVEEEDVVIELAVFSEQVELDQSLQRNVF